MDWSSNRQTAANRLKKVARCLRLQLSPLAKKLRYRWMVGGDSLPTLAERAELEFTYDMHVQHLSGATRKRTDVYSAPCNPTHAAPISRFHNTAANDRVRGFHNHSPNTRRVVQKVGSESLQLNEC